MKFNLPVQKQKNYIMEVLSADIAIRNSRIWGNSCGHYPHRNCNEVPNVYRKPNWKEKVYAGWVIIHLLSMKVWAQSLNHPWSILTLIVKLNFQTRRTWIKQVSKAFHSHQTYKSTQGIAYSTDNQNIIQIETIIWLFSQI